jgi:site-specific recombinase XerD
VFSSLRVFYNWLLEEGEVPASPMARTKAPKFEPAPPPILAEADLRSLLKVCEGRGFFERRDSAILRLLLDTGVRRAEVAGLRLDDGDLDLNVARVIGEGSRVASLARLRAVQTGPTRQQV